MSWKALITDAGNELSAKTISGGSIKLTHAKAGSGTVSEQDLHLQTELVNVKQTLSIESIKYSNAVNNIEILLDCRGLKEAYDLTQIGIYATDPDAGEILFAIAQTENPKHIPAENEVPFYSIDFNFAFALKNNQNMVATIDQSTFATKEQLSAVDARIDNIIVNAGSTEDNAELIDMRVDVDGKRHSTAGEALRSQLKQKANLTDISSPYQFRGACLSANLPGSGNKINDTYYVTDKKCKFTWNGAAWYQSSLNESDYEEELSSITEDLGNYELKNDLAVVNYEFEHFGYISSNGENISSTENAKYTNFIRVHAGDKFEVKAPIGDAGYSIACYDSNEKILIDSSVKGNYSGLFTVPEGVEFIRCSFYGLKNTAYCRSCPKYNFPELKAYVSSNIDEINNFGIKLEGLKPQFTEKGYLMTTDGTVEKSDYGKCTDFIYIPRDATNIKNHTVNGDYTVASVCFYDSEKNYIASLTTTERDVDIDITAEEYSSAEYVRLSYYNYKSDDSIGPNGIIYNKESVEIRFSKVDERIKNIEGFGSANLNVLIFGDSITDCASFTVSNDVTTKYNFSGMNTYINANGETIKYKMWPKIFESKMKCKDLRNYARSGASYKNDARESGEERRNLSYQIQLAINDVDNAGGAFNQSHFEPDIIIFALGTNDGVPNDTPASAYSKIITTGTGIDVSATLSNLDMSKFCESVIYAYMQIRKYFPYAMIFNVLPIQRMANDVPLGTAHDYLKEISQKIANAIIIDGAYESGIIKQNNLVSGLGETLKDGLHPNEKGQNMMARMIISKVKSHYVSFDNMND